MYLSDHKFNNQSFYTLGNPEYHDISVYFGRKVANSF